jgi:VIT1/CCC1 family predicted Fe2+/Mn2+ transporter
VLIGFGIMLVASSFVMPAEKSNAGPSYADMRLVWGVLLAMGGVIGMVNAFISSELWVAIVLILLTIGILILIMTMKGMLKIKR